MTRTPFSAACLLVSTLLLLGVLLMRHATAEPLDSRFTYQGELRQSCIPANGQFDFEFQPFNAASAGTATAAAQIIENVEVSNGVFSVELDLGWAPFSGDKVWLEVRVRQGASTGGFTGLLPRQALTAAPYALHAASVGTDSVGSAQLLNGSVRAVDVDSSQVQRRVSGTCTLGAAVTSIRADGTVTCSAAPSPVAFRVRGLSTTVQNLPAGPAIEVDLWRLITFNVGGGYVAGLGRFVAPSSGTYYLHASVVQSETESSSLFQIGFNVSATPNVTQWVRGSKPHTSVSGIFRLSAGQEVFVTMRNHTAGSTTRMLGDGSWFEGFKISD